jgi:hypothetical protein
MSFAKSEVESGGSVQIEESQEPRGSASEMSAMERDLAEEVARGRAHGEQSIASAVLAGFAFLVVECTQVRLVLDLLAFIERPRVARDLGDAVEHAHGRLRGDECERLSHDTVRNGVVVTIEADIGRTAGGDRLHQIGREEVLWQRKKAPALLDERVADEATIGVAGDGSIALNAINPTLELIVEILSGVECARGQERFAYIANPSFDAALFIPPRNCTWLGAKW